MNLEEKTVELIKMMRNSIFFLHLLPPRFMILHPRAWSGWSWSIMTPAQNVALYAYSSYLWMNTSYFSPVSFILTHSCINKPVCIISAKHGSVVTVGCTESASKLLYPVSWMQGENNYKPARRIGQVTTISELIFAAAFGREESSWHCGWEYLFTDRQTSMSRGTHYCSSKGGED